MNFGSGRDIGTVLGQASILQRRLGLALLIR